MSQAPVEPRVGDRERHAADELLRAAVGDGVLTLSEYDERAGQLWAARTRSEVDVLLADLPGAAPLPTVPTHPSAGTRRVVAVMSDDSLSGPLAPGQDAEGWAVIGKAVVDLRRTDLPHGSRVRAGALMGEVEVQVPPGTTVHLTGFSLMGERKVRVAPGDGPVVHVAGYALMGTVTVTVGDGSVVSGAPAQRARAVLRSAPVEQVRPSPVRRAARRVGSLGLAGALALGAVGAVASGSDARAVFGSATTSSSAASSGTVAVSVLFGSVEVVVPDGAQVDTGGLVVFGSVDCEAACSTSNTGPRIAVRPVGAFGSVAIVTESELAAEEDGRPDPGD